jgi:mRNA-degrading endonuclease toxin of MazEF toxin-antitoxin module
MISTMKPNMNPRRGEIWMVNFEPQTGKAVGVTS